GGTASIGEIETAFPVDLVTLGGDIHAAVELPGAMNAIGTFRVVRFDTAGVAPPQTVLETTALRGRGKLLATDRALLARTLSETSAAQYFLGDGTAAGTYLLNTTHPEIGDRRGALHAFGKTVLVESESMSQPGIRIDTVDGSVAPQSVTTKIWMDSVVPLGGRLIGAGQFSAQGGLWSTDATEDGTRQIAAIVPTTKDGTFVPYAPVTRPIDADGVLLFNTTVPGNPTQWSLWRSDGTEAGTWPLPAVALGGKAPYTAVAYGGEILVKARDAGPTAQLFATDAAFAHVTPLRSFYSGDLPLMRAGNAVIVDCAYAAPPVAAGLCLLSSAAAQPMPFLMLNNNEFVPVGHVGDVAIFGGSTAGIWRSDGTIAGTYRLLTEGTYPWTADQPSAIVGGRLYFRACSRGGGCSLASTDGTVAGTRIIAPMPSGDIAHIEPYGNGVAYATNLKRVWSLYVSDGTAAGTREVLTTERIASGAPSLAVVGNRIHVLASFFTPTLYLVSDGTLGGTRDVVLPSGVTLATGFVAALDDETAVFACSGPAIGEELCAVDREGTQPVVVADLRPGPLDSRPRVLGRAGDALYLVANDGIHGSEPWRVRVVGDGIFASGFETQP
ncbi:MAG TPA: hypothetical protein VJ724_13475, partial [Tahibacter sp.]|nr:hypothetical protein [Tahibacter sp.]